MLFLVHFYQVFESTLKSVKEMIWEIQHKNVFGGSKSFSGYICSLCLGEVTHEAPGPPGLRPTGCLRSPVSGQRSALDVVVFALVLAVLLWSDFFLNHLTVWIFCIPLALFTKKICSIWKWMWIFIPLCRTHATVTYLELFYWAVPCMLWFFAAGVSGAINFLVISVP